MVNSLSKVFAALLAVMLLYIYPAAEAAQRQDDLSRLAARQAVTRFVDAVRTKGFITPLMYSEFTNELALTGNLYDINLEHQHLKYVPDYLDAAEPDTFQGSYQTVYDGYYNAQIFAKLYPGSSVSEDGERRYLMTADDFFSVRITNTNRTMSESLRSMLLLSTEADASSIYISYGGMVLNEAY
ncbi:hypothetical protein Q5741_00655 [Paenibacillus sp. JX-17]|uniref:DUF3993 domain-containing protein n=1 Tax=Paenibacillus lacisoli TaxID=3064525 RepID=A0ABT9CBC6_9BACL|nr:hypothetical protein [Paenibacillus sp. JX-17]MDO7904918.1 hypothetical protein [Paenibacillus sp. JX-17]